jgi:hypothetical protein
MVDSKISAPIEPRYAVTSPHLPSSLSYGKYTVSLHLPLNTYETINKQSLPHGKTRILAFLTRLNQMQMLPQSLETQLQLYNSFLLPKPSGSKDMLTSVAHHFHYKKN